MRELADEEVVYLGEFAEQMLASLLFERLVQLFRLDAMDAMLSTQPADAAERERIYQTQATVLEFVGFLQRYVKAKDKLLGERKPNEYPAVDGKAPPVEPEELTDEQVFALVEED